MEKRRVVFSRKSGIFPRVDIELTEKLLLKKPDFPVRSKEKKRKIIHNFIFA